MQVACPLRLTQETTWPLTDSLLAQMYTIQRADNFIIHTALSNLNLFIYFSEANRYTH